jgi:hypothetical protein
VYKLPSHDLVPSARGTPSGTKLDHLTGKHDPGRDEVESGNVKAVHLPVTIRTATLRYTTSLSPEEVTSRNGNPLQHI